MLRGEAAEPESQRKTAPPETLPEDLQIHQSQSLQNPGISPAVLRMAAAVAVGAEAADLAADAINLLLPLTDPGEIAQESPDFF